MVTFLATSAPALVSPGLDLERSFSEALESFGLSEQAARLIWLPLPMLLVLVAAGGFLNLKNYRGSCIRLREQFG